MKRSLLRVHCMLRGVVLFLLLFCSCLPFKQSEPALGLTYLGQSGFAVRESRDSSILLIDPTMAGLRKWRQPREQFQQIRAIFISTRLDDHFDLEALKYLKKAVAHKLKIFSNAEVQDILATNRLFAEKAQAGSSATVGHFTLQFTTTNLVRGREVFDAAGLIVSAGKQAVYYTGPTQYVDPLKLGLPMELTAIMIPITGQGLTMDFFDAGRFCKVLQPRLAIPVGFQPKEGWKKVYPEDFLRQFENTAIKAFTPEPGREFLL